MKKLQPKKLYLERFQNSKKEDGFVKNKKNPYMLVAIDYGIKKNILRYFSDFNCKVTIVSCKTSSSDILKLNPNGIFFIKWSW